MIRRRATVNVLCGLILCGMMTGCSDSPSPTSPTGPTGGPSGPSSPQVVDRTFTLALNQSASVNDGALELTFRRVVKDERCGMFANCIAGMVLEAALEFDVVEREGGFTLRYKTQLATDTVKAARIGSSYTVSLEQLAPYPMTSAASDGIKPEDYRVTVRITSVQN
jgi:hypothetical protein